MALAPVSRVQMALTPAPLAPLASANARALFLAALVVHSPRESVLHLVLATASLLSVCPPFVPLPTTLPALVAARGLYMTMPLLIAQRVDPSKSVQDSPSSSSVAVSMEAMHPPLPLPLQQIKVEVAGTTISEEPLLAMLLEEPL